MKLTVCIPMYNEAEIIEATVSALISGLEKAAEARFFTYELIFSDDGSDDGCGEKAKEALCKETMAHGTAFVVRSDQNRGKGHAVRLAVAHSTGEFLLYTDCDLAYGVDVIGEAYGRMTAPDFAADILIGSRNLQADGYAGYTWMRKLASKCYIKVLCLVAGFRLSDSQCGCKAFRGDCARAVFRKASIDGWAFDFEVLMLAQQMGYRVAEFPVKIINHRESKIHLAGDSIRMLRDIFRLRRRLRKENR